MALTLKAVKAELALVGINISKQDGEYRVARKGTRRDDTYSEAYFTSDLADAWKTGLLMALPFSALSQSRTLAAAVEHHSSPVTHPTAMQEFKGGESIKTVGGTFKVKANAYGNWYGYQGSKRVEMFWGDYVDQMFSAALWLRSLRQAEALAF